MYSNAYGLSSMIITRIVTYRGTVKIVTRKISLRKYYITTVAICVANQSNLNYKSLQYTNPINIFQNAILAYVKTKYLCWFLYIQVVLIFFEYHLTYVCVIIWTNKSQTKRRSSTDLQGVRYTSEECAEQLNRRYVSSYRNSFLIQQNDSN